MKTRYLSLSVVLASLFVLAACGSDPAPVQVFVTPTPQTVVLSGQEVNEPADAPAQPIITPSPILSSAPASPTPTIPAGVPFGPIVGPGHTLVPTETRVVPTELPTVQPTAGPSPTPLPGLRSALMGVQIHPHIDNREYDVLMDHARKLGVTWIKFQYNWSLLESAPGQYTELFYMMRLYVQQAHDKGFQVMISVAKAPGWSRTPDPDGVMREDGPPDDPQALANFITGMLNQIGRNPQGRPFVSALEIWNEPNLQREWHGYPMTGAEYMRYFRPAYQAARAFAPDLVIITAAPAPTGDSEWSSDDRIWLKDLYAAGLAAYGSDIAVGIHPYGWANSPDARCCANPSRGWDEKPQFYFLDTIEDYRAIMVNAGHESAQLWTTEFGWATFDGLRTGHGGSGPRPPDPPDAPYFGFIDQWQQAQYTIRAFDLAQQRSYMGPMILWNLNFATIPGEVDKGEPQTAYGMLDTLWQPRPVYKLVEQSPKN